MRPGEVSAAEGEVAAVLRGERLQVTDTDGFAEAAHHHAVGSLLVHTGAAEWLPAELGGRLRTEATRQAATWAIRARELQRIAGAVESARLDLLVVKGAHLACTLYPDAAARACVDVDLFVRPAQHARLVDLLEGLGFVRSAANVGDAALGQAVFERPGVPGTTLDVHSRLLSPIAAAAHLDFETLWRDAVPFAGTLRAPARLHALQLAVLHIAFHHPGRASLRWLYDLHLLLKDLPAAEARRIADLFRTGDLARAAYPLLDAQASFPTAAGATIAASLRRGGGDPAARVVDSPLRRLSDDLRSLPSWRARLRLLAAHLFPPPEYMRRTYAPGSRQPLGVLYLLRIVRGVRRWV